MKIQNLHLGITFLLLQIAGMAPAQLQAQQSSTPKTQPSTTPSTDMAQVDLPIGSASPTQLKELLPDLLSKKARFVILSSKGILRITDYPNNIESLRIFLKAMHVAPRNVRIEVTQRSTNQTQTRGTRIRGQVLTPVGTRGFINGHPGNTPGVIRRVTTPGSRSQLPIRTSSGRIILPNKGSLDIDMVNQRGSSSSLNRIYTLVKSGGQGLLEVVRDIPMVDYFTRYKVGNVAFNVRGPGNINQNFAAGGTFELPEFRWEKAGAQLIVRPIVHGDLITIEVIPRISAVVIANPQKLTQRRLNDFLTGADQYVTYTGLKTTVTVKSGHTITIGSFPAATREFNAYFWGGTRSTSSGGGSITLKATIQ
ncbi:MAG: hypothetical protein L3J39_18225 [Verrucomicrobiales bacterium]|nr:hypothetical protein [Verrucomicrobiales bacterium]